MISVGIVGGTGYTGVELLRLLAQHPHVEILAITSRKEAGIEVSDLFPHIAAQADRLCVIRSMQTEQINHDTAHAFMNTGSIIKGRRS